MPPPADQLTPPSQSGSLSAQELLLNQQLKERIEKAMEGRIEDANEKVANRAHWINSGYAQREGIQCVRDILYEVSMELPPKQYRKALLERFHAGISRFSSSSLADKDGFATGAILQIMNDSQLQEPVDLSNLSLSEADLLWPTWDDLYYVWWNEHCNSPMDLILCLARLRIRRGTPSDWKILSNFLSQNNRDVFVCAILKNATVPKQLLDVIFEKIAICRGNRGVMCSLIESCTKTWGVQTVIDYLMEWLEKGDEEQKAGTAKACSYLPGIEDMRLTERLHRKLLQEYVSDDRYLVRWNISLSLNLDRDAYVRDVSDLIEQAIAIASKKMAPNNERLVAQIQQLQARQATAPQHELPQQ